jgi:subtilisin-like proprotein convertase family protein
MRTVLKLVSMGLGAALAVVACATGTDDLDGGRDDDNTGGSSGTWAAGSGSSTGAMTGTGAGSGGSAGGSSSGASGGAGGAGSGTGGGGVACVPAGDQSVTGTTGACSANQNCPVTTFTAVVAGAPGPIVDVDVSIDAIAASTDQNILRLQSPQGTIVTLFNHHGTFLTDDFVGTMFDDEAAQSVATAPGPFHGCYKPTQPLTAFQGQSANGTWTLLVETCLYETSVSAWTLHLDY